MPPSDRFLLFAEYLGGVSENAYRSFFYWRDPLTLQNWSLNVIELLLIVCALLGLAHACAMLRRRADPSFVAIWVASVVYVVAIEIPIYFFLGRLGLADDTVIFVHNQFSAGAFFGRMPLYIAALYPAILYPAYVLVLRRGLFAGRAGAVRGAVVVGVVHHAFYAIFDHLGPQLRWWAWDYQLPGIGIANFDSVPLYSAVNFSLVVPIAFAFLAYVLLTRPVGSGRPRSRGPLALGGRTMVVGVLTPVLGLALSVNLLYAHVSASPDRLVMAALSVVLAGAAAGYALTVLVRTRRGPIDRGATEDGTTTFLTTFAGLYVVVLTVLWITALPAYFGAVDGTTAAGTPTGSLFYAAICVAVALFACRPYFAERRRTPRPVDAAAAGSDAPSPASGEGDESTRVPDDRVGT